MLSFQIETRNPLFLYAYAYFTSKFILLSFLGTIISNIRISKQINSIVLLYFLLLLGYINITQFFFIFLLFKFLNFYDFIKWQTFFGWFWLSFIFLSYLFFFYEYFDISTFFLLIFLSIVAFCSIIFILWFLKYMICNKISGWKLFSKPFFLHSLILQMFA